MSLSFVALDFETANARRGSACSLGMTKVINGQITAQKYEIFRPPTGFEDFEPRNISIHGIRPEQVAGKPQFGDLWSEFEEFRDGLPLVAHNASFDISVLRASLLASNLEWPELDYVCTMVLSRNIFELTSHSLLYVAQKAAVKWDSSQHHDALYDSEICAGILLAMAKIKEADSVKGLLKSLNLQSGKLFVDSWHTCRNASRSAYSHHPSGGRHLKIGDFETNTDADPNHPLFGKVVVFTGKLYSMPRPDAWKLVASIGAIPKDGMSKSTNLLVVGEQDPFRMSPGETQSGKFREAEKLRNSGIKIEVINETDFLAYIEPEEGTA
jgi:DNA polymerase-3 subunit epsilon